MTATIDSSEWLTFVTREYLGDFVAAGGSTVKFVIPVGAASSEELVAGVMSAGREHDFITASVDSGLIKVHMIDQLFFAVAQQVPWIDSVRRVLRSLANTAGYRVPLQTADVPFARLIGDENDVELSIVLVDLKRQLGRRLMKDTSMGKDFRVAMTQLCLAEVGGGEDGIITRDALISWLTGQNRAISAVKRYQIFAPISRANARHHLRSLTAWAKLAGYGGTAIVMDIGQVLVPKRPADGTTYYTRPAVLDTYEVLRQFIDDTDRSLGCLLVVVAPPEFLDDDVRGRGLGAYEALKFRVFDEVHDRRQANPLAALVRVTPAGA